MVSGIARSQPPRSHMRYPERWPHSPLRTEGDPCAAGIQIIAAKLTSALDNRGEISLRELSRVSGVNRQAISELLSGQSWPDVLTVFRLETALDVALWPGAETPAIGHIAPFDATKRGEKGSTNKDRSC